MGTELAYLKDAYKREFQATVTKSSPDFVVLDSTYFYPEGGGQPSDKGFIEFDGKRVEILKVLKENGEVRHYVSSQIPAGSNVKGVIDWERRYKHMRMHTSQHLVSAVVADAYNATVAGNQIGAEKSRIDFHPAEFKDDDLRRIEDLSNSQILKELPVSFSVLPRKEAVDKCRPFRVNWEKYPESLKELRMVEIKGLDFDPCGGTHVNNTKELGKVRVLSRENKGKQRVRIEYELA